MGILSGNRPSDLGVRSGNLKAPPPSPNAVSSQAGDASHQIAPLAYKSSPENAMKALKAIVEGMANARIVESKPDYLYAEYTSPLLGFVDDVEFYAPPNARIIHVRSASRLGYSDLGVNRKRIEAIRAKLNQAGV